MKARGALQLLTRLAAGGILIYAGFMKAVGPAAEFAAALEAYKLFPPSFLTPIAHGLPYLEMWVGLFLLTGFYTRGSALAASGLFAAFLAVVGSALARGIDLASCGCFGAEAMSPKWTLAMDVAFLILSFLTYKTLAKTEIAFYSLDSVLDKRPRK